MNIQFLFISLVTFILFCTEALIHFTIGKNGGINKSQTEHTYFKIYNGLTIHIPDKTEFYQIVGTTLFFSLLSGIISSYFIKY